MQKPSRYHTEYEGSTLRKNLYGAGRAKLAHTHPAATYRGADTGAPRAAETPVRNFTTLAAGNS